jgi:phage FluMu protein Com
MIHSAKGSQGQYTWVFADRHDYSKICFKCQVRFGGKSPDGWIDITTCPKCKTVRSYEDEEKSLVTKHSSEIKELPRIKNWSVRE